ncbi:MocR-like pyridoxine biosynthesis transcription factor PdxR [Anaerotignum sp.]|uniref:MocR-like pyridoxine biosynthesis transcription factor PdxR n=1 Tax=Anaerotignum sp. TaxID=2039241 RepID=UPI002714DA17|nr:PLP-dependent aminotransferase family protein [Anaerotignum sp.]
MLTYNLENRGNTTLYEFLYTSIKNDIVEGKIIAYEKLPSKRTLADHLKISTVTVENAYMQLLVEGYIYSVEKKGYYVSKLQKNFFHQGMDRGKVPINTPKKQDCFMDFKANSINAENFPFSVWSKLTREVLNEKNAQLLQKMPFNGIEELRHVIAEYLYRFRGMVVSQDQIVIGAGTEYLYNLLIQFFGKDIILGVENPGYSKISEIYKANDVACEYISLDQHGLSISDLEKSKSNIIHISPAHHFPTGIVMPIQRRQEILNWANEQENRYIIEDDYDSEFRFTGRPIQTLQSIDENEKVIYINTFTKSIAPTIRISYMVLPPHLMESFRKKLGFYSCTVSSFEQYTLARFMEKGYFERHINRMRNFYKSQRDLILKEINESALGKKVKVLEKDAGLHFILDVNTRRTDLEIMEMAREKGIEISCLSEYYMGSKEDLRHRIIINYSSIDGKKVREAVNQLLCIIE